MEEMSLPLHIIYILIRTSLFSFGRNKSLVSAEAATKLHLAYLNDPRQVRCEEYFSEYIDQIWRTLK